MNITVSIAFTDKRAQWCVQGPEGQNPTIVTVSLSSGSDEQCSLVIVDRKHVLGFRGSKSTRMQTEWSRIHSTSLMPTVRRTKVRLWDAEDQTSFHLCYEMTASQLDITTRRRWVRKRSILLQETFAAFTKGTTGDLGHWALMEGHIVDRRLLRKTK